MTEQRQITVRMSEETFPPHHDRHGTASTVVIRSLAFELPEGQALWEQSDYGHPGRFNEWEPRGIPARLQPRTADLKRAAEGLGALLA